MRSNQQQNNQHFHCSHPRRRSQSSRCRFIKALHCWPFLSANADSTLWAQVSIKPADHCVNVPVPPWVCRTEFAAMTKPSLRDTLIFVVILSLIVAAMFALVFGVP